MVRPSSLLPALLGASTVLAAPANFTWPPIQFDPGDWWAGQTFTCPLWKGSLPQGAQDLAGSVCNNIWTKTVTVGSITAKLYQVPGPYTGESRYSEIINGAAAALQKGLDNFGSLAGPLTINIGVVWGVLGSIVQVDDDNAGTNNPCYILFNFPPSHRNWELVAIQKEIVQGMYQCVEQFHRPNVNAWTDGNKWWRRGIARYFDGLAYPAPAAIMNRGLYPEEYAHGIPLYQNRDASALFFHFADSLGGWSPTDVNTWMKGHPDKQTYAQERTSLSTDAKITSALWHRFILACKDKTITYPNGQKIGSTLGGPPERIHNAVVNIASVGGQYSKSIAISAWQGATNVFTIKGGQTMSLSLDVDPGIEWSVRKVGTSSWNSGNKDRSVTIAAGGSDTKFEIAVSSTRDDGGSGISPVKFKRTA